MSEKVTITKERLEDLVRDSLFLMALDCVGVDNWDGYEHASEVDIGEVEDFVKHYMDEAKE